MKDIKTIELIIFIVAMMAVSFVFGLTMYSRYDVNRDGKVTSQDYIAVKNYIMEQ